MTYETQFANVRALLQELISYATWNAIRFGTWDGNGNGNVEH